LVARYCYSIADFILDNLVNLELLDILFICWNTVHVAVADRGGEQVLGSCLFLFSSRTSSSVLFRWWRVCPFLQCHSSLSEWLPKKC